MTACQSFLLPSLKVPASRLSFARHNTLTLRLAKDTVRRYPQVLGYGTGDVHFRPPTSTNSPAPPPARTRTELLSIRQLAMVISSTVVMSVVDLCVLGPVDNPLIRRLELYVTLP